MLKQKSDPDLGDLEFQDIEGSLSYNCKISLPISEKQVNVFFETISIDKLPSPEQKQFLQCIIDDYTIIINSVEIKASSEIGDTKLSRFDLDTIGIPLIFKDTVKWDLSLISRDNPSIHLLANFDNMIPLKVWKEVQPKRPLLLRLILRLLQK